MIVRPVFALLAALAMMFAPFVMQGGGARAAMPLDHQARSIDESHCSGGEMKVDLSVDHSCCAAMCSAAALGPALAAELALLARGDDQPAIEQFGRSHLAKLPTPPPRAS